MATYKKLLKNRAGDTIIPVTDRDIYSTTEQVIGEWIDGKPVYRKVYTGTLGTTGMSTVADTSDISRVVKIGGYIASAAGFRIPCPFYGSSTSYFSAAVAAAPARAVYAYHSSNFNSGTYQIVIEYTKTTD